MRMPTIQDRLKKKFPGLGTTEADEHGEWFCMACACCREPLSDVEADDIAEWIGSHGYETQICETDDGSLGIRAIPCPHHAPTAALRPKEGRRRQRR